MALVVVVVSQVLQQHWQLECNPVPQQLQLVDHLPQWLYLQCLLLLPLL
jgi:hypothetical protein